jgi:transposase
MAMYYIGLDLHAKSSTFCVVNRRGKRTAEGQVPSSRVGFKSMIDRCEGQEVKVVVEASTRTRWAAEVLERLGAEVVVVDPRKIRVIAETKHKTDRTDARILADLLRTGALPEPVWQAPRGTRELRDQVRLRWGLVRERANLMLRGRSLLASVGISLGKRALASEATWDRLLKRRDIPDHMKKLLRILKKSIEQAGEAITAVEKEYEAKLDDPVITRLREIPSVGPVVAVTTVASLGDPGRFPNSRAAAAYTGLVPTERSSGGREKRGHMTKQGPSELRRVWIQAAQAALRMRNHPLKTWAHRLIYRRGRSVAVVALARRLFRWAFAMWRDNQRFKPELAVGAAA